MSGKYNIDENMQFDTIIEMLTYYMSENKTFSSHFIKLQTPIVRQVIIKNIFLINGNFIHGKLTLLVWERAGKV